MSLVALKGLAGRKLRSSLTALAIVLGVAMISGTYVLTDTITTAFHTIFTRSYQNTDVVISGKVAFSSSDQSHLNPPSFSEGLLAKVRRLPDVAAAVGSVSDDQTRLLDHNGKTIQVGGAPTLGFSVDTHADQRFNPLELARGRWPSGPTEVAIDASTAKRHHFDVGQSIDVAARGPVRTFAIAGIVKFSGVSSIGGATMAVFDLPTAQQLFDKVGKLDIVRVAGKTGVPSQRLLREIRPLLPATAQIRDAAAQAKEDEKGVNTALSFIQKALLAFGGIALFVGSFVIANTLSITIAQRTRELATLRTIGASRRQVLWSIVLEALVIGVVASVIGLFVGLGLAKGLNSLFVSFGIDLPQASTVFSTRTIVVSLLVGIVITLLASLRPALRATRVAPIAAVREGAVLPRSRFSRWRPFGQSLVLAAGLLLLLYGIFGHDLSTVTRLLALGGGCVLLFLGVAMLAPRLVPPLASVLGAPGARIAGASGQLARENAMRNPTRTASTAAALMIGLALVTFVSVLAFGIRKSFSDAVDKLFVADYAVMSQNGFEPLSTEVEAAARNAPNAELVSGIRAGSGRAFGKTINVTAVEPNLAQVVRVDWKRGGSSVPARLGARGAFVDDKYADKHHLAVGSPLRLETPTGRFLNLVVKGIYDPPKGGSPFGSVTMSAKTFDANYPAPENLMTFVNTRGGISTPNTSQLELVLNKFPDANVQTRAEFKKQQLSFLNNLLNLLYVLLGLSVLISLFGIVNTLVLTVFERTRELGMLRAVGMTRRQVRRMIRHESIVTALIGAALGIVLGIFLARLVTIALSDQGFTFAVPYGSLVVFVIAAIVAGILAAILPARRASRINVLEALQYE